jgi:hypothetical protein
MSYSAMHLNKHYFFLSHHVNEVASIQFGKTWVDGDIISKINRLRWFIQDLTNQNLDRFK